jgi:signal transduction histidine kinase
MIARLEAGSGPDAFETVEIGALARDVHELYEPVADDAGVQLTVDVTSNPVSRVNRHLLGQALANLIDNALKYGVSHGRPGQIGLGVSQADGFARIVVSDNGPGVAESERDRVLRRFVRLEASRSKPGTGLGLSLVAAVARIYKGRIKLEDNAPGLRVVLELPLA